MFSRLSFRFLVVLLTAAGCAAASSWISGTVYVGEGPSRRPLSRVLVLVRAQGSRKLVASAETDAHGRYQIADLPRARIRVSVFRPGYYTRQAGGKDGAEIFFDASAESGYPAHDFELARGGVITGRIVGEAGEPVEKARVDVAPSRDAGRNRESSVSTPFLTDDRGVFRIAGLEPGFYLVMAGRKGAGFSHESEPQEIELAAGEVSTLRIPIKRLAAYRLSGNISGLQEAPSSRISVHLEDLINSSRKFSKPADGRERFDFLGIPAGKYRASASVSGIAARRPRRLLLGVIDLQADMTGLSLRPLKSSGFRGAVKVAAGTPPRTFRLSFLSKEHLGQTVIVEAPDYSFQVSDLLPGSYHIKSGSSKVYLKGVMRGENVVPPRDLRIFPGTVETLEIAAAADHGKVQGTIRERSTHQIVAHGRVAISGESRRRYGQADQLGHFLFSHVVPGEYRICAWADIHSDLTHDQRPWEQAGCEDKIFQVTPDSDVEIDLTVVP